MSEIIIDCEVFMCAEKGKKSILRGVYKIW